MFYIGFKGPNEGERQNFCNMLMDEMILDIVTGETTELDVYKRQNTYRKRGRNTTTPFSCPVFAKGNIVSSQTVCRHDKKSKMCIRDRAAVLRKSFPARKAARMPVRMRCV